MAGVGFVLPSGGWSSSTIFDEVSDLTRNGSISCLNLERDSSVGFWFSVVRIETSEVSIRNFLHNAVTFI